LATYSTSDSADIDYAFAGFGEDLAGAASSGRRPTRRKSRATVSDGFAPRLSQSRAFSSSTFISIGSVRGL